MSTQADNWHWSDRHRQPCRVLDTHTLWDQQLARIWLPSSNAVVQTPRGDLRLLTEAPPQSASHITFAAAASRIVGALADDDVLLAPLEGRVTPLPHQLRALGRAVHADRRRFLLADEVGLGKTIEAGLILRELKLRGHVKRVLVVAPKGLVTQWIAELSTHFGEALHLLQPSDTGSGNGEENLWQRYDQVICSMDAVKPIDSRKGWSKEQVAGYNRARFENLIGAGWDLVIVDEAHRLGGSADSVARYRLGQGLAGAAPALLLLSATPHQGKTAGFARIVTLLDPAAVPDRATLNRERVQPYVIRTEKRQAIDAQGLPLFQPRITTLVPVAWEARHQRQQDLYDAVTDYVRHGYNRALAEHRNYIGFLMLLIQRLVTSSTQAIISTLERRLTVLREPDEQLALPIAGEDDLAELDGQEQIDALIRMRPLTAQRELSEVEVLLAAARQAAIHGPDAKAEALLSWINRLRQEETDPSLKVLIFTEFVPTQEMLRVFLGDRGFAVVCLNGSMDMTERHTVQEAFAGPAQVLVSTDAGGEGLNLQFCHVVVNYDIPWNPMRLEQRIGRVDRIGQTRPVRAFNLVLEETVEYRVREVLETKLALILKELGVDKTGDVLDSGQASALFDGLYVQTLLHPEGVRESVEQVVAQVRAQGETGRTGAAMLQDADPLDPLEARRVLEHPLPRWMVQMTAHGLRVFGGQSERSGNHWNLVWPDGERQSVTVEGRDHEVTGQIGKLGIADPKPRALLTRLPIAVAGLPVPCLALPSLPAGVDGLWSVWRIALQVESPDDNAATPVGPAPALVGSDRTAATDQHVFAVFIHDNGRVFLPTARHIWDTLIEATPEPHRVLRDEEAITAFTRSRTVAESQGEALYMRLRRQWLDRAAREQERAVSTFAARRRILERIGLPAMRMHRLAALAAEEAAWRAASINGTDCRPELTPLLLVRIESEGDHGRLA